MQIKSNLRKSSVLLALTFFGVSGFAAQDSADLARQVFQSSLQSESVPQPVAVAPSSTAAVRESAGTSTAATTTPNTISINPSAAAGKQSQGSGAAVNQAAGQALMAAGSALMSHPPTVPAGAALMAMGVLAMMQSGHDSGAAGQSAATFGASSLDTGSLGTNISPNSAGTAGYSDPKIAEAEAKLEEAGYKVTAKGVTNPDGSFTPASAFSSPGAMSAAGMDPAAVKEASKVTAALNDEISKLGGHVSGVAVNEGGGGGYSAPTENNSDNEGLSLSKYGNPFAMNAAMKKNLIAGKTVNFDGEPIGVSGNNIFDMVHTAYEKKRAAHTFIETESGGPQVLMRAPASVVGRSLRPGSR